MRRALNQFLILTIEGFISIAHIQAKGYSEMEIVSSFHFNYKMAMGRTSFKTCKNDYTHISQIHIE